MNAVAKIAAKLNEVFAPLDAEILASSQEWAKARKAAIVEFKASDEYQQIRRNAYALYVKLHALSGGKTWYQVLSQSDAAIAEFVTKNCEAIAAKRNASIARKLDKEGITEVVSEEITKTHDGFNGFFVVNTDKGRKSVHVETIVAGGYNIQCRHLRVLVKVK